MKVDVVCNAGSVMGVTPLDIYGKGVGGADLALMSMAQALAARGHQMTVYNDPLPEPGTHDGVAYCNVADFSRRADADALIVFRTPNPILREPYRRGTKRVVWWPTDKDIAASHVRLLGTFADVVVCISPFHATSVAEFTPPSKTVVIDCGVRIQDYTEVVERVPGRVAWCSVPDRGLPHLLRAWPIIKAAVPGASLRITSDYRLWGLPANVEGHRQAWVGQPDVEFLGRVPRRELCRLQQEAEVMAYTCTDEELFCISAAECQVAGAVPVTPDIGCLATTNAFGMLVRGTPWSKGYLEGYADFVSRLLGAEHEYLERKRGTMMAKARERFAMSRVAEQWEAVVEGRAP